MSIPSSCLGCPACLFDKSTGSEDKFPDLIRFGYNPGLKGKNYDSTRIMFILNRSDSRALENVVESEGLFKDIPSETPYARALRLSDTGRTIRWLMNYCDLSMDDVYITNAFKCIMPEDKDPRRKDYIQCAKILKKQIMDAAPKKILVFGSNPQYVMKSLATGLGLFKGLSIGNAYMEFFCHPRKLHDMKTGERQKEFKDIRRFLKEDSYSNKNL